MNPAKAKIRQLLLLIAVFFSCEFNESGAQTLDKLSDSVFSSLKSNNMEMLIRCTPSYSDLKLIFDSVYKDKSDPFILVQEHQMKIRVRKQYFKLLKTTKSERIELKKASLLRVVKQEGVDSLGVGYARVMCRCESGQKNFTISYVALNCGGAWRLADELLLEITED